MARTVLPAILVLLAVALTALGQGETNPCPTVSVTGPSHPPKPMTLIHFTVAVLNTPPDTKLTYKWLISSGTIVAGQKTRKITARTSRRVADENITATVEIKGLPSGCPDHYSETAAVADTGARNRNVKSKNGILTTTVLLEKRKQKSIRDGGDFHVNPWRHLGGKADEDAQIQFGRVRAFIWDHWLRKQEAYVTLTYQGTDSLATYHYIIESDGPDKFQIGEHLVNGGLGWEKITVIRYPVVEKTKSNQKGEQGEFILLLRDPVTKSERRL